MSILQMLVMLLIASSASATLLPIGDDGFPHSDESLGYSHIFAIEASAKLIETKFATTPVGSRFDWGSSPYSNFKYPPLDYPVFGRAGGLSNNLARAALNGAVFWHVYYDATHGAISHTGTPRLVAADWRVIFVPDTKVGPIPEPATALLLGTGLLGLVAYRRWRPRD